MASARAELELADWRRLNGLLERGLDYTRTERQRWLSGLDTDDRHLAPLLDQLLDRADDATGPPPIRGPGLSRLAFQTEDHAGDLIGPYRLLREIARGGMGVVWLAERADGSFRRQVALKLPADEFVSSGLVQRMARERDILAALVHPNIAQLHDAGLSANGRPYLALEYVEGEAIDIYCARQQLDVPARVALFIHVVNAVAYAHAHLVVHRDLKPGNVLVTGTGEVKLLDFGIAKLLEGDALGGQETALTRQGVRPLTLGYAAPEQVLGQSVSVATDIHALGAVLYELLAGIRPFAGTSRTRGALETAIVQFEPPPPSRATADALRARALRGDFDTIVLKALKKLPVDRYASATALADDLQRLLRHEPVRAQRDSRWYRARKFATRNALPLVLGAAVAMTLFGLLGAALRQAQAAREAAEQANIIKEFVLSTIRQGDPLASAQNRASDLSLLIAAESRIAQELRQRPQLALEMQLAIGNAYANRGEYARASRALRSGIEAARPVLPATDPALMGAQIRMADLLIVDGAAAEADLDRVIAALREGRPRQPGLLIDALLQRHKLWRWSGDPEKALEDAFAALALATRADVSDEPRALVIVNELASTLSSAGRAPRALEVVEPAYRRALERGGFAPSDPRLIEARSWYGRVLCQNGRAAEGMPLLEQAESEAREHHGALSQVTAVVLGNVAFGRYFAGELHRAVAPIVEAHDIVARREPVSSHYRSLRRTYAVELSLLARRVDVAARIAAATPYGALEGPARLVERSSWSGAAQAAWLTLEQGDIATAAAALDAAIERLEAWKMRGIAMRYRLHLAVARLRSDQLKEAEAAASEVVRFFTAHDPKGVRRAQAVQVLGEVRLARGDYVASLGMADDVLRSLDRGGAIDSTTVDATFLRARSLFRLGRTAEALPLFDAVATWWTDVARIPAAAAEAAYWRGRALAAGGDASGRGIAAAALRALQASASTADRQLARRLAAER